jgi:hypothetical protein
MIVDDLQNTASAETVKRFRPWMSSAALRIVERLTHQPPNIDRKLFQVIAG